MPVSSVTFEEILDTIQEETVVLKIDIEGAECKVKIRFRQPMTELKIRLRVALGSRVSMINWNCGCLLWLRVAELFFIASYYRQLSAEIKMKSYKISPERLKALSNKTGVNFMISILINLSEWLRTGPNLPDDNRFRSHTGKKHYLVRS